MVKPKFKYLFKIVDDINSFQAWGQVGLCQKMSIT